MNTLQNEIINTRKIYRELFNNAHSAIERQIDSLKKASLCNHCKQGCDIDFNKITVLQKFPGGCRYKFWQESVLNLLENQISKDIYERIQIIEKRRQTYSCACCSSCCKLASSEYSFEELKQRAKNGDVFSKEFITEHKINFKPNYILMLLTSFIYIALVYRFGIQNTIIANLDLIKFMILTPMLLSVFVIDYKSQIIPNRLNLTIFEIGMGFAFLYGLSDVAITINMLLGMLAGGGIFLLITVIGGIFYGKEAMGFGDVKLMGALGLFFGLSNIVVITLVSFLIGAILSIVLLITKIKKSDEYIPFGPFIVIATFISMYVPFEQIKMILMQIFTLGMYKG